jgi:hypothetical protein
VHPMAASRVNHLDGWTLASGRLLARLNNFSSPGG